MKLLVAILSLASVQAFASPASNSLDLRVSGSGLIMNVEAQSCVDMMSNTMPPTRSLAAPSMTIPNVTLMWFSPTMDFFIGEVRITLDSHKLSGHHVVTTLDANEVEALFGATNGVVHAAINGQPTVLSSSSAVKPVTSTGFAPVPCSLRVGSVPMKRLDKSFTADATIEIIGTASNAFDGSNEEVVTKSIKTQVTYY